MEIGTGGAASDAWDEYKGQIPPNVAGGAQPPDVHNEVDAVYVAAAILRAAGAPGDWAAALKSWNDYPPEWAQVDQLVSQYTHAGHGHGGAPPGDGNATRREWLSRRSDCAAGSRSPARSPRERNQGSCPTGWRRSLRTPRRSVQRAIAAGNRIIHTFYSQERRAGMLAHVQDSYDCSGASDYILYQAGLSDPTVDVGDAVAGTGITIESYGQPGPGRWITVFGSSAHEFIKVDNIVMDTAHYAPVQPSSVPDPYPPDDPTNGGPTSGPRWQPASIIPSQLNDGNTWVPRHPAGPVMRSARLTLCSLVASPASPQRRPAAASQHTASVRTAVPQRCRQQQHRRSPARTAVDRAPARRGPGVRRELRPLSRWSPSRHGAG